MTITRSDLARAWSVQEDTVSRALRNVPRANNGKKHVWYVADVIPASPARGGQAAAESVLVLAAENGESFTGTDDDLASARAIEVWISANCDGGAGRIHQVRVSFFNGLARAVRSSGFVSDVERLRLLILRESGVLRFALTGEKTGLPADWTAFARAFALTVEARQIDDQGQPIGAWQVLGTNSISDRTNTPIRRSWRFAVTPGRYAVRVRRDDTKSTSASDGHAVLWAGLRAYLPGAQGAGPVTLIAMRMRATNNLSMQASRQIAVLATRKLPVWTGTNWTSPVATRSIAWAIADAARNADYGPGMIDAEIDLDALMDLAALWDDRGDRFDGRFDQPGTWWEQIQRIARAGRAACFVQGGVLRTVRDGPASVPTLHFSERNIQRGSFVVDYLMPTADTADTIIVSYFDATSWSEQTVRCRIPGSRAPKAAKVQLFGVTGRDHAARDGIYLAASNQRRRRIVRFDVELEGRMPMIGELISVQHAMPAWGAQAEVLAWDGAALRLTLSEPMTFDAAGTHYVGLRRPDGSLCGPIIVTPGPVPEQIVLATAPNFAIATGTDMERTQVSFGAGSTWAALAKVADIKAKSLTEYTIQAVLEDPSVHTAEIDTVAPPVIRSQLPAPATRPVVRGLIGRRSTSSVTSAVFAWEAAAGADSYQIEMAEGDDPTAENVTWTRVGDTTSNAYAFDILYPARTMIRVRAVGLTAGPWIATTLGSLIPDFWLADELPLWLDDSTPFWST